MLVVIEAVGNLAAVRVVAGILWTAASPTAAFVFLASAMLVSIPLVALSGRGRASGTTGCRVLSRVNLLRP